MMDTEQINYKWHFRASQQEGKDIPFFFSDYQIPREVTRILMRRGINNKEQLDHFLSDTLADLHDPFLMKGMEEATARILKAVHEKEAIVIYGDYDVDGITSTAVLYLCLRDMGATVSFYIPSRENEGYGLNEKAVKMLAEKGAKLLITVDCGISSADLIAAAPGTMDIIVTDHHMPPDHIPEAAVAVINPHQRDCLYPYKDLAGVGVAYAVCRALYQKAYRQEYGKHIELVALGTIADVVSLTGENRILVKEGLGRFTNTPIKGLTALLKESGIEGKDVSAERVSFSLAPRLNAAGRVAHANKGVALLTTESEEEAEKLAHELQETNYERQNIERMICQEAKERVMELQAERDAALVVDGENWHPGVIGIVASRLMETYHRPVLMLSVKDGIGKGSCRSIPAFNMYEALKAHASLLLQFGGHKMAAGFSIEEKNIPLLRKGMNEYAQSRLMEEDYIPQLEVEDMLPLRSVSLDFIRGLAVLEPCGCDNPKPLFASTGMLVDSVRRIGTEQNHLKCFLSQNSSSAEAVYWNFGTDLPCHIGDTVSAVYDPQIHVWYGEKVQLVLKDIRKEKTDPPPINRDMLVQVYLTVRSLMGSGRYPVQEINRRIQKQCRNAYTEESIHTALTIFEELGILLRDGSERNAVYQYRTVSQKLDLTMSATYRRYHQ